MPTPNQPSNRSSSNRVPRVCDAVVMLQGKTLGPLRLPEHRADDFIAHFNRTYQAIAMELSEVKPLLQRDEQVGTKKNPRQ
ncbi:MAG: hypothetical protein AB8B91_01580 [Rubripirellula sp.]